jgi:hypothetical protein
MLTKHSLPSARHHKTVPYRKSGRLPGVFYHSPGKILTKYVTETYDRRLRVAQRFPYCALRAITKLSKTFLNMLVVTQLVKKCSFLLNNPFK